MKEIAQNFHIELGDYQQKVIDAGLTSVEKGIRRPSVVLATGGGETVVFSHLIPQLKPTTSSRGGRVLVLVHKEELVYQAAKVLQQVNPVHINMGTSHANIDGDIFVGSACSVVGMTRLNKYNPNDFKAIIMVECHYSTAT